MQNLILTGMTINEMVERIGQELETRLKKALIPQPVNTQSKYLSREETAKLLKISLVTLNEWTKLEFLQSYKIRNRVLYKPNEIEQALHKVLSNKYKRNSI